MTQLFQDIVTLWQVPAYRATLARSAPLQVIVALAGAFVVWGMIRSAARPTSAEKLADRAVAHVTRRAIPYAILFVSFVDLKILALAFGFFDGGTVPSFYPPLLARSIRGLTVAEEIIARPPDLAAPAPADAYANSTYVLCYLFDLSVYRARATPDTERYVFVTAHGAGDAAAREMAAGLYALKDQPNHLLTVAAAARVKERSADPSYMFVKFRGVTFLFGLMGLFATVPWSLVLFLLMPFVYERGVRRAVIAALKSRPPAVPGNLVRVPHFAPGPRFFGATYYRFQPQDPKAPSLRLVLLPKSLVREFGGEGYAVAITPFMGPFGRHVVRSFKETGPSPERFVFLPKRLVDRMRKSAA